MLTLASWLDLSLLDTPQYSAAPVVLAARMMSLCPPWPWHGSTSQCQGRLAFGDKVASQSDSHVSSLYQSETSRCVLPMGTTARSEVHGLSMITQREGKAPSRDVKKQQFEEPKVRSMSNEQGDVLGAGLAGRRMSLSFLTWPSEEENDLVKLRDACSHRWKKGSRGEFPSCLSFGSSKNTVRA